MKKVVYRDILGNNPRKHEVSMEETVDRTGNRVTKKRGCKYFIEEMFTSDKLEDLKKWIADNKGTGARKDCHILRRMNTETGENMIICKVLGDFFVVWKQTAYKIVYVNEVKIKIEGAGSAF